jgi:hypothetical protein
MRVAGTTDERTRSVVIVDSHFEEADMQSGYGFGKTVSLDFDDAISRVTEA